MDWTTCGGDGDCAGLRLGNGSLCTVVSVSGKKRVKEACMKSKQYTCVAHEFSMWCTYSTNSVYSMLIPRSRVDTGFHNSRLSCGTVGCFVEFYVYVPSYQEAGAHNGQSPNTRYLSTSTKSPIQLPLSSTLPPV